MNYQTQGSAGSSREPAPQTKRGFASQVSAIGFIVISVPPLPLREFLAGLRSRVCEISESTASLAYPPHITLRTGFRVTDGDLGLFLREFESHAATCPPAFIRCRGWSTATYESEGQVRRWIGIDIERTTDLIELHGKLLEYGKYQKGPQSEFRPHLTLAYHDLTEAGLARAARYMGSAEAKNDVSLNAFWKCEHVSLYRFDSDSGSWAENLKASLTGAGKEKKDS